MALNSAPGLGYADYSQPFVLEPDARNESMGVVISQVQDGRTKVIAYASRGLRGGEKNMANYSSKKLELLPLKWAVTDKLHDYLHGAHFIVFTDNNPLTHVMTQKKLPVLEQRWVNALAASTSKSDNRQGRATPMDSQQGSTLAMCPLARMHFLGRRASSGHNNSFYTGPRGQWLSDVFFFSSCTWSSAHSAANHRASCTEHARAHAQYG